MTEKAAPTTRELNQAYDAYMKLKAQVPGPKFDTSALQELFAKRD